MRTQTRYFFISLFAIFVAFFGFIPPVWAETTYDVWFEEDFEENFGIGPLSLQPIGIDNKWDHFAYSDVNSINTACFDDGNYCVINSFSGGDTLGSNYYFVNGTSTSMTTIAQGYICVDAKLSTSNQYLPDPVYAVMRLYEYTTGNVERSALYFGHNGDISYYNSGLVSILEDYTPGQVYRGCIEWNQQGENGHMYRYGVDGDWTDWVGGFGDMDQGIEFIVLQLHSDQAGDMVVVDNFGTENPADDNTINFTNPADYSTQTTDFYLNGNWSNVDPENYNEVQLFLGREDSFTMQFLCTTEIADSSGNFSCLVDKNDWYQQNWIVQPLLTLKNCDQYGNCTYLNDKASNDPILHITFSGDFPTSTTPALTFEGYTFEDQWENFEGYYASTSDKWSTSTQVGLTLNATIGAITNWLYNLSSQLTILDTDKELAGQEVGLAIRKARGYTETINNLFADFPLAQIFTIYILVFLLVLIIRLIKFIRGMIK